MNSPSARSVYVQLIDQSLAYRLPSTRALAVSRLRGQVPPLTQGPRALGEAEEPTETQAISLSEGTGETCAISSSAANPPGDLSRWA